VARYGRAYAASVLSPLAEQVLLAMQLPSGSRVLQHGDDGGALMMAAARHDIEVVVGDDAEPGAVIAVCTVDGDSCWAELETMARRGHRVAAITWDAASPPPHERALQEALAASGSDSSPPERSLCDIAALRAHGWRATVLHDVARFDSIQHCWTAMRENQLPAAAPRAFSDALAQWMQRDETLRIPVDATLLQR
jgi:hypothetical protein